MIELDADSRRPPYTETGAASSRAAASAPGAEARSPGTAQIAQVTADVERAWHNSPSRENSNDLAVAWILGGRTAEAIALLAGIESLLSCVIADRMTGRQHKSNIELIGQGIANIASALFGGIPATGALARTATNIRAGALTPVSGMLHASFLLLFMWLLAPLAGMVPLAALAGMLVVVAWGMSEADRLKAFRHAARGDQAVLVLTFGLTVLADITTALIAGMALTGAMMRRRRVSVSFA